MTLRPLPVLATLVAALALLVVIGARLLARDREALFERYAHEREQGMQEAARGLASDVADIGEDLELASTLLQNAETTQLAERELHAIATIKREYLAMYARLRDQPTTRVTAADAPPGIEALAHETLERMLLTARSAPGTLRISGALAPPGQPGAWYRVFARRPREHGPSVAVAVDMAVLLARIKLSRDAITRIVVLDARGEPAALSDRELATLVRRGDSPLQSIADAARAGTAANAVLDGALAHQVGLPATTAVGIAVPIAIDEGPPWTLLAVASTIAIETQEKTLVRRVLVGGVLVLVLLLSAAAYVIRSSYRARALRERLRMEQRLLHSEKLVTAGQLAAGIAHEVGTPLNVARGRAELTLSHLTGEHAEAANQRVVIEQIDRVTRLIQQLLDYVRPAPAAIQTIDLAHTLQVVVDLLGAQAAKRGVELRIEAGGAVPPLRADPDQVQQIIVNLVVNALDACERGGHVVLRLRAGEGGVTLEVADDGQGIPRDVQKQVFDPFFTTKKRGQGTGLGLWVVAQLVRAQAGEIELDSAPGRGTTVRVAWPVMS